MQAVLIKLGHSIEHAAICSSTMTALYSECSRTVENPLAIIQALPARSKTLRQYDRCAIMCSLSFHNGHSNPPNNTRKSLHTSFPLEILIDLKAALHPTNHICPKKSPRNTFDPLQSTNVTLYHVILSFPHKTITWSDNENALLDALNDC